MIVIFGILAGVGQCVFCTVGHSPPGGDRVRNGHGVQLHRDLHRQQQGEPPIG